MSVIKLSSCVSGCFLVLLHSVQALFLMQLFVCVCTGADLQNGHVLWPDGQPPAQRLQTDAVRQPADALCRSLFLHLHQPAALPLQLSLHGSSSPGQSSPPSFKHLHRKGICVISQLTSSSSHSYYFRCPMRQHLKSQLSLYHQTSLTKLSPTILSETKVSTIMMQFLLHLYWILFVAKVKGSTFVSFAVLRPAYRDESRRT